RRAGSVSASWRRTTTSHPVALPGSWGKSHQLVVGLLGVLAGPQGIADHRVFIDAGQACRLADPAAILEVLEDGEGPVGGEPGREQGGALALGESLLARAVGEHPPLVLAVAEADPEVALVTQAVVGAIRVLTTKQGKVFHEATPLSRPSSPWATPCRGCREARENWQRYGDTT